MSRRVPLLTLAALGLVACSSGQAAAPEHGRADSTVGDVGALPPGLATVASAETSPATSDGPASSLPGRTTTSASGRRTTTTTTPGEAPVGQLVDGNRVLIIGDSIIASTSSRYGGEMCDRLVPAGWAVEVDAEVGQHIPFGQQVLSRRLAAGWDAAVIMLGSNYNGDPQDFDDRLSDMLDRLAPRPVVLVNVTQFEENRGQVNYVLQAEANHRDDVRVVGWAARTAEDDAGALLTGDGLHLTDAGRSELVSMIGEALGRAPAGSDGDCLSSTFADDGGRSLPGTGSSTGTGSRSGTGSGSGSGTGGGTSGSGSGGGAATPTTRVTTPGDDRRPPAAGHAGAGARPAGPDPPAPDPPAPSPVTPPPGQPTPTGGG